MGDSMWRNTKRWCGRRFNGMSSSTSIRRSTTSLRWISDISAVKRHVVTGQLNVMNGLSESPGDMAFHSKISFKGGLFVEFFVDVKMSLTDICSVRAFCESSPWLMVSAVSGLTVWRKISIRRQPETKMTNVAIFNWNTAVFLISTVVFRCLRWLLWSTCLS